MPRVHQLLPSFMLGDAMGAAALGFQRALRHLGVNGEVFADEVAPSLRSLVRPLSELRLQATDWALYHHGIASPLAGRLLHVPARKAVVFHNVTPARFYPGARLEEPLRAARAQLTAMAAHLELSLGVSAFNARELVASGHQHVQVVPLFVEPERFTQAFASPSLTSSLARAGHPRVVSVSRVVPHKRVEDLLSLHEELRRIAPEAELWVVGSSAAGSSAYRALERRARRLGGVRFLGRVTHDQLVAAYRCADVFVSMSEHEGFGVPLMEAMAADLPVLAFGAAAVPETLGGRGVVFDEKHFAGLAELVLLLTRDGALRTRIIEGQRARVGERSFEVTARALAQTPLVEAPARPLKRSKRPTVTVVVQRYGAELTGGAEAHARQVVERLSEHASVSVLTTCAVDHLSWANLLPEGVTREHGVTVERFPTRAPRQMHRFNRLSDRVLPHRQDAPSEAHWLAEQGPDSPRLLDAIATRAAQSDAFIFFTYLYAPTVWGVPLVANKAIVVPTTHDEPPLRFEAFRDVFERARVLFPNTPEESALIAQRFPNASRRRVVGVGIEPRRGVASRFAVRFGVRGPYLLYVGRMEPGKGVPELVERHQRLVRAFHDAPALVLLGAGPYQPRGEKLFTLGRVDETAKWDALSGCLALVVPSRYESLSLVTLEAMAAGAPVLGNEASAVVMGQLRRSGGGYGFHLDQDASFREAVRRAGLERQSLGEAGRRYAAGHSWDTVVRAYLDELEALRR